MIPKSGNRFSDQVMHSEEKALSAAEIIRMLGLRPHPEGGHFTETHRDDRAAGRAHSTAIYFLLARGERSHWHRVDATEVWHYYAGAALRLETAASSNDPSNASRWVPTSPPANARKRSSRRTSGRQPRASVTGLWWAARSPRVSTLRASSSRPRDGRRAGPSSKCARPKGQASPMTRPRRSAARREPLHGR
jgi:hypothetical protein